MTHPLIQQVLEGKSAEDVVSALSEANVKREGWVVTDDGRIQARAVVSGVTGIKVFLSPELPRDTPMPQRRKAAAILRDMAVDFSDGKTGQFRHVWDNVWQANMGPFIKAVPALDTPGFQLGRTVVNTARRFGLPL